MKFISTCAVGLENYVTQKINAYASDIEIFPGIVIFECDKPEKLINPKIVDDILFHVKKLAGVSRYRHTLKNIRHQLRKSNFLKKTKDVTSFFVEASYTGKRDYTAKEIRDLSAGEIKKKYSWKYDKENADIHISINLDNNYSFVGISFFKKPLHVQRALDTVPGSLKNSVATFMLELANVKKKDVVLDPMCGSGVIPIEASELCTKSIGGDVDNLRINLAKQNSNKVVFHVWDATKTNLKDNSIDKIVCNLPFGKQVNINNPKEFFNNFINEMLRVSKKKFCWVFLTTHEGIIDKIITDKKLKLHEIIDIQNSGLDSKILLITP